MRDSSSKFDLRFAHHCCWEKKRSAPTSGVRTSGKDVYPARQWKRDVNDWEKKREIGLVPSAAATLHNPQRLWSVRASCVKLRTDSAVNYWRRFMRTSRHVLPLSATVRQGCRHVSGVTTRSSVSLAAASERIFTYCLGLVGLGPGYLGLRPWPRF